MVMEITGSIQIQCEQRLTNLYTESHPWLIRNAVKLTKNREEAEELVSELYVYLLERCNPKIFWGDSSYNLLYCNKFLHSRWMNRVKKLNKVTLKEHIDSEEVDVPYDEEFDKTVIEAHKQIMDELKVLEQTRMWPQSRIFQLYFESDDTMESLAKKIGISKSTTFLAIKKIRRYLKEVINNPFDDEHTKRNL